jgi:hypothetical protein
MQAFWSRARDPSRPASSSRWTASPPSKSCSRPAPPPDGSPELAQQSIRELGLIWNDVEQALRRRGYVA